MTHEPVPYPRSNSECVKLLKNLGFKSYRQKRGGFLGILYLLLPSN